jgi:hypothetical protein
LLRISLSFTHSQDDLQRLLLALAELRNAAAHDEWDTSPLP